MTEQTQDAKPTAAGLYDAYLEGDHHTLVEEEAAARVRAALPETVEAAWANRAFHQRSARFMTEQGIRQFIDLGAGLPTQNNTHQVLAKVAPGARCVYVDVDPRAVQLGRELIENEPHVRFVQADLREVEAVLGAPEIGELIDFSQPIGLLASAVFHFISDEDDPWGIANRYVAAIPSGSYVAISHGTTDKQRRGPAETLYSVYKGADRTMHLRNREQVEGLFEGLEFIEPYKGGAPKVHYVGLWFCDDPVAADDDPNRWFYGGVARKP